MKCHICRSVAVPFARAKLCGEYDVQYYLCSNCGFVQTEYPYWLEKVYDSNAINDSDIGLVGRSITTAQVSQVVIHLFFDNDKRFLDFGGGYGLFVRLMRNKGLDFYRYDPFCENLFAKGFDVDLTQTGKFELVTAFEVFEHFVRPVDEIGKMLCFSRNILFRTALLPPGPPKPEDWWYYGVDHGQHVSLYTRKTLEIVAKELHLNLASDGDSLHLLSERKIPSSLFHLVTRSKLVALLSILFKKRALLAADYQRVTGRSLA